MKIRNFFTKKRIIWTAVIVVVLAIVGLIIRSRNAAPSGTLTDTVKKQDLKQTVLATGQVTSTTDLNLSFQSSGVVNSVRVKVGDKVKNGQILANLEQRQQAASLTSARGALASAQANYDRVLAGASSEEVAIAQTAVDNANKTLNDTTRQQAVLVSNAHALLLNSSLAAVAQAGNVSTVTVSVSGTYSGNQEGTYSIRILPGGSNPTFIVSGLESGQGEVKPGLNVPLGTRGLYVQFSGNQIFGNDVWTIEVPNTKASNYNSNFLAYQASLQTQTVAVNSAQSALDAATAQLNLKKAEARPADVSAAQAQILSAQGQYQAASASFENTIIRAPADGTITAVDIKEGELASALKEALILQDVANLHVEANVSEANIANLKIGQSASMTLDALGPDRKFTGQVVSIDPASTVVSGVVNYKVTASLEKLDEIKPGMTANMTIETASKPGVLAVPSRAVLSHDNKKFVRVVTDSKKKTYKEVEVTTGLEADGGVIEITSGLTEGQEIVTFVNQK